MSKPVYCHLAIRHVDEQLEHYALQNHALELYISGDELDDWKTNGTRQLIDRILSSYHPPICLHGPIFAFDPATNDAGLLQMVYRRSMALLEIAGRIGPETIVFHSSYIDRVRRFSRESWIADTAEFYLSLVPNLPGERCRIAIENIFESDPEPLSTAIYEINHPRVGHCFDIGHFNMFQKHYTADKWLAAFPGKLYHLHLHDNHGQEDLHLPPGQAGIDFEPLLGVLNTQTEPFSITVEGKSPAHNDAAAAWVRTHVKGY